MQIKNLIYFIIRIFIHFIGIFYYLIGIKKNNIIFCSQDNEHYSDNSRYLFEYLSKKIKCTLGYQQ